MVDDWPVNLASSSKLNLSKFLSFSSSITTIIWGLI